MNCTGVILAGGRASRFGGRPKGLEVVAGSRIIDRVAATLRDATDELLLVSNDAAASTWLPGVRTVGDLRPGAGPLGGIHSAIAQGNGSGALVLGWDMPFVPAGLLRALRLLGEGGFDVAVAESGTTEPCVEPLCAWYGPGCLAAIERRLDAGDHRVAGFFPDVHVARLAAADVAQWGDPQRIFWNVNSPDDLANAPR
jgi:molybdopterin-guanine dinucleotide biosynthesis protein A